MRRIQITKFMHIDGRKFFSTSQFSTRQHQNIMYARIFSDPMAFIYTNTGLMGLRWVKPLSHIHWKTNCCSVIHSRCEYDYKGKNMCWNEGELFYCFVCFVFMWLHNIMKTAFSPFSKYNYQTQTHTFALHTTAMHRHTDSSMYFILCICSDES